MTPPRVFLDTCVLIKRYVKERGSETSTALLARPDLRGELFVSRHIEGEVVSALNRMLRKKRLKWREYQGAMQTFAAHYPAMFSVVPPHDEIMVDAVSLLHAYRKSDIGAPDAHHLAAARYVKKTLMLGEEMFIASADRPLVHVAKKLGFPVFNVESDDLGKLAPEQMQLQVDAEEAPAGGVGPAA